jgi:parvulin-like peptidyl-prolyl isomerase
MDAAFALSAGGVSGPIATDNGTAVVKVIEKQTASATDWTQAKPGFNDQLLNDRRNRFFSAYMIKAKQKMKIDVNREALQKVVG